MITPGIHRGLAMADYLKLPALSASTLQVLIEECPAAAWHRSWLNPNRVAEESDEAQGIGTIAHSILLEGSTDCVVTVDAPDWRTKAAKEARDAAAAEGKVAILAHKMGRVLAMVQVARGYIESLRKTEPAVWAAFQPDGGESENTLVWDEDGVLCRARPDRVAAAGELFIDYKTVTRCAHPDSWGRTHLAGMGYYVGAAFYLRAARAVYRAQRPEYLYLVQEQEPPFLCSLVGIAADGIALGRLKVEDGLRLWRRCAASNKWPGYPTRACYVVLPAWEAARWEAREVDSDEPISRAA